MSLGAYEWAVSVSFRNYMLLVYLNICLVTVYIERLVERKP